MTLRLFCPSIFNGPLFNIHHSIFTIHFSFFASRRKSKTKPGPSGLLEIPPIWWPDADDQLSRCLGTKQYQAPTKRNDLHSRRAPGATRRAPQGVANKENDAAKLARNRLVSQGAATAVGDEGLELGPKSRQPGFAPIRARPALFVVQAVNPPSLPRIENWRRIDSHVFAHLARVFPARLNSLILDGQSRDFGKVDSITRKQRRSRRQCNGRYF